MTLWQAIRRFDRRIHALLHSPPVKLARPQTWGAPPPEYVARAEYLRGPPSLSYLEAVALFQLAAERYRLIKGAMMGGRARRRGWKSHIKRGTDAYIVRCMHHADGIAARTVRSRSGRWTLAEAMGEAFGENARTIERAWQFLR